MLVRDCPFAIGLKGTPYPKPPDPKYLYQKSAIQPIIAKKSLDLTNMAVKVNHLNWPPSLMCGAQR